MESRSDDLERLDHVLRDSSTPPGTRATLLRRASLGALGLGIAGFAAGCGGSSKKAATTAASTTAASGGTAGMVANVIDTAITAEALAVTYLSAVIAMTKKGDKTEPFLPILKAANTEEYDHYKALKSLGAKPLTLKFWVPNDFFGANLSGVFPTLEVAETLFVNAYLIGATVFAKAGKADFARYAGEILGVESEHLALVRYADGKIPNDLGFMSYDVKTEMGIVQALEGAGVGFGKKGSKPGTFAMFKQPEPSVLSGSVTQEAPQ